MIRPIIFNGEMVRAILEGRKTVTRRCVKAKSKNAYGFYVTTRKSDGAFMGVYDYDENEIMFENPQTQPAYTGDILYVRETWTDHYVPNEDGKPELQYCYKADGIDIKSECLPGENNRWYPSIHMPKEAARIFLKVKDVRVERLQEITEEQSLKEGVPDDFPISEVYCPRCKGNGFIGAVAADLGFMEIECSVCDTVVKRFKNLWNTTIKKSDIKFYGWDANPWVWVIEFERCEKLDEYARSNN